MGAAAIAIPAAASIIGGILGGKGASKAAKTQLQGTREQIAAANANRDYQYNLNTPTINAGNDATSQIGSFLKGDASGVNAFRANTGYQDLLKTGLDAVNANAYARGAGNSGAAYKALQQKATGIADQSAQGYLGNLQNLAALGGQARANVAGVGSNTVNAVNGATQAGTDASGNASLIKGGNWQNIIGQLGALGTNALSTTGSSYTPSQGYNSNLPSWLTNPPALNTNPSLGSWARL